MKGIINKRRLFGDEYRALGLLEFPKEMPILRRLIKITADAVACCVPSDSWSHEGVCHMFAKSVADYLVMAYDNLVLGHFYSAQMILRSVVENSACLNIIHRYPEYDLWKYYLVQSYYEGIKIPGAKRAERDKQDFDEVCEEYGIPEEFLIKSKKNGSKEPYAYIDKPYGWTYPINKNFNFAGVCNHVNPRDYGDFKLMSMYSHGTSLYLKMGGMASVDHIMSMITLFYYNIYKLVDAYCSEYISDSYYKLMDELEQLFDEFINESEQ